MTDKQQPIEDHKPEQISSIEKLANEISDTNSYLRRTFSWRMIIARGLLTGLAIVIGSTVFAGVLFAFLRTIFGDISFIPSP